MRKINREKAIDITFFLLRIVVGFLFIQVGGMKLFGWFGIMPQPVPLFSELGLAGFLEVFGGLFILLGFCTRTVAFILAGEMAVAYWQAHAPLGMWPVVNQGQPAVLFCFIFLFIAAYGAGKWSIDRWLRKRRENSEKMPLS